MLLESCFCRAVRKWPEDFVIQNSDYSMLLLVALSPEKLSGAEAEGLKLHFLRFYTAHPDFTLAILAKLRKAWNTASKKFTVKKFIMENHGWIDGEMHINSSEFKLEAMEKRISELLKIDSSVVKDARQDLARGD